MVKLITFICETTINFQATKKNSVFRKIRLLSEIVKQ